MYRNFPLERIMKKRRRQTASACQVSNRTSAIRKYSHGFYRGPFSMARAAIRVKRKPECTPSTYTSTSMLKGEREGIAPSVSATNSLN